jgi:Mat/Ecp fimbriae major subunit
MRGSRILLPALLVVGSVSLFAAGPGNATSGAIPITAKVFTPIALSAYTASMQFGDVFPGSAAGTVVLNPLDNSISSTGTGLSLSTIDPTSCANITVSGRRNASFSVAFSTATLTSSQAGATSSMTVDTWTAATANVGADSWTILGNGNTSSSAKLPDIASSQCQLRMGGTLHVPSGTLDGDYSGSYTVTVTYN